MGTLSDEDNLTQIKYSVVNLLANYPNVNENNEDEINGEFQHTHQQQRNMRYHERKRGQNDSFEQTPEGTPKRNKVRQFDDIQRISNDLNVNRSPNQDPNDNIVNNRNNNTTAAYFNIKHTYVNSKFAETSRQQQKCESFPPFRIRFKDNQYPIELAIIKAINRQCNINLTYGRYSTYNNKKSYLLYANSSSQYDSLKDLSKWPQKICDLEYELDMPNKTPTCYSIVVLNAPPQWDVYQLENDFRMQHSTVVKVERLFINGGKPILKVRVDFSDSREVTGILKQKKILLDENSTAYLTTDFSMTDTNITIGFLTPNGNFAVVSGFFNELMENNTDLQVTVNTTLSFPPFYACFERIMPPSNPTGGNVLLVSRLIPETIVRDQPDQVAEVFFRTRGRSADELVLIGHLVAGGQVSNSSIDNSVNPAWRTALLHMINGQGWSEETSVADQELVASRLRVQVEILETVGGGAQSACYLNEADPIEPNWQQKFFGTQAIYDRLKSIKKTVDPNGLFICKNCVGSDDWSADPNCLKISSAARIRVTILVFLVMKIFGVSW
ncbi:unnamed protein product [Didymodactylos carnosus]|uniref:Berberine/berberine-like domain-containing protein n=1 Tax=Didymodactylos carnosus TaxID=1234261 RepID=A0A815U0P1_9BILA|nr:unnamed protein product [Didymodactylos carnosus]CAF1515650.1 unnamed protein product [Didymodactylos carnosus]CAF3760789.1 unnamed protein product [Didymodactylos carnosus]CAF4375604.1 unnamed protein product [Didymodactylos carnosus]